MGPVLPGVPWMGVQSQVVGQASRGLVGGCGVSPGVSRTALASG